MCEKEIMVAYIKKHLYIYIYKYIIAEAKRKWIPTIKAVVTNRISAYPKFRYVPL